MDHQPIRIFSGPHGSRTHHTDLAGASRPQRHAGPSVVERSVQESNPVSILTTDECCRNTYRPFLSSDPGWNRTRVGQIEGLAVSPTSHRAKVTRTEIEVRVSEIESLAAKPSSHRAVFVIDQCPEQDSNLQPRGFKASRSAELAYLGRSSPGWTRTTGRHLVGVLPLTLGHRTVSCFSGPTGSRTRISSVRSWRRPVGP